MIERYARLTGGSVVSVGWPDGPYPVDEVLDAVTDRTSIVVVVSPNSPSGLVATARDIERLSEGAPRALLLVDLAYVEFADEDLTSRVLEIDNAILVRSMSKAWGLAGLRVGWAAGPAGIIDWLRAAGHPYAVSAPSLAIARERLRTGRDDVSGFVSRIREERSRLTSTLRTLGVRVPDSQSNFVLGRFADAGAVRSGLAERGIAVRIFPGKPGLEGCLRITLPGEAEGFERLTRALTEILTGKEVTP
jgi:histidinol-phosphate aminotransferase